MKNLTIYLGVDAAAVRRAAVAALPRATHISVWPEVTDGMFDHTSAELEAIMRARFEKES